MRIKDWMVVEFLTGSPEPPVSYLSKGSPVYASIVAPEEKFRISIYHYIEDGVLCFTKYSMDIFGNLDLYMDNYIITEWVNLFCSISTDYEKSILAANAFSLDFNHSKFRKFPKTWFEKPVQNAKKVVKISGRKVSKLEKIFSIRNEDRHKVLRVCGLKLKFKKLAKV